MDLDDKERAAAEGRLLRELAIAEERAEKEGWLTKEEVNAALGRDRKNPPVEHC